MPSSAAQPAKTTPLTKREVIEVLGKSKRTIETYIKDGRLTCTYMNGKNGRQALFDPEVVAELKREIETPKPPPVYVPAAERAAKVKAKATADDDARFFGPADVARIVAALTPQAPAPFLMPHVSLAEAVKYSGLPAAFLISEARAGRIRAVNVGKGTKEFWRFAKAELNGKAR